MRLLYLHIGHIKTGSTYIQSALSANRVALRDAGLDYPAVGDDARSIDRTRMTPVGNARSLLSNREELRLGLAAADASCSGAVYSSELMFDALSAGASVETLVEEARRAGFGGIRVLLFTRNPISHGVSVWQQRIKGWQAETASLDSWLANEYRTPEDVLLVMRRLANHGDIEVTVRNYSSCKGELLAQVSAWLGVPPGTLAAPSRARENRSLTPGESVFQHALNREIGRSGDLFAFRLVESLPDVKSEALIPNQQAQETAWARLEPTIRMVNELVSEDERYEFDHRHPKHDASYSLSEEQVRIIAMGVGAEIRRLRAEVEELRRTSLLHQLRVASGVARRAARRLRVYGQRASAGTYRLR